MGMPVLQQVDWTAAQAIALPSDGNRYEVLDGELFVTPAPTWGHQAVIEELLPRLKAYVAERGLGWVKLSPADLVFSPRRLVQPDIFVVPAREAGAPSGWADVTSLLLAVEVLSPSTARADRHRKRLIYQEQGVAEYWIVDAAARLVERWRPADSRPEQIVGTLVWQPDPTVAGLRVELPAFFRAVHDEAARPRD
jgi:Uma2 family endonuclease